MKTELEQTDIETIVKEVIEAIKPLLGYNGKEEDDGNDHVLTPDELAEFLKVKKSQIYAWVNESKHTDGGIPFMKPGKFLRFSKKEILVWAKKRGRSVEDW